MRRPSGRRLDHRGRLRRRVLLRRRPLPTLKSVDTHRARDLCRDVQQVAVSVAAPRLHALAAVADRRLSHDHEPAAARACRRRPRPWSPSSWTRATSIPTFAACGGSTPSATMRCARSAKRKLRGLLTSCRRSSGLHTIGHLRGATWRKAAWRQRHDARQRHRVADRRFSIAPIRTNGLVLGFGGVRPSGDRGRHRGAARRCSQVVPNGPLASAAPDAKAVAGRPITGLLATIRMDLTTRRAILQVPCKWPTGA